MELLQKIKCSRHNFERLVFPIDVRVISYTVEILIIQTNRKQRFSTYTEFSPTTAKLSHPGNDETSFKVEFSFNSSTSGKGNTRYIDIFR